MSLFRKETVPSTKAKTKQPKRWEAFEHSGQWFVISPLRGTLDGPTTQKDAERKAERLNAIADAQAAFLMKEN